MKQAAKTPTPGAASVVSKRGGILQRACACGNHASGGECESCKKKHADKLQRSAVNDAEIDEAPEIVHEVLRAPGQLLDDRTRAEMGSRFGHDFSGVRVHSDARAAESARAVNARAYAVGQDVVFESGHYEPQTPAGRYLLAHELAHTIQSQPASGEILEISSPSDPAEREAQAAAQAVVAGESAAIHSGSVSGGLFRAPPDEQPKQSKEFTDALAIATSLETKSPGWLNVLPACPCKADDARKSKDFVEDGFFNRHTVLQYYHPGADTGFRSAKGYPNPAAPGTSHGQQCTYDGDGKLITSGKAAGTPDFWSAVTNNNKHQEIDVNTVRPLGGWQVYNKYWIPNNGNGCPENTGQKQQQKPAAPEPMPDREHKPGTKS